jgi:prefoldin subunit 5
MKRWMMLVTVLCLPLLIVEGDIGRCEPVKGYSSYIQLLPGGKDKQITNFSLIEKAKEEVRSLEIEKKKRDVKFERPVDIYYLNTKYTMVSFEVFFRPLENSRFSTSPAIYGLLFDSAGQAGLSGYTSRYVKWIGKSDIDEYKSSNVTDFCGYFRRAGVEDCVPSADAARSAAAKALKEKAIAREGRINADQIASGRVKADFIDASIARKKDVDKVVETSMGRIDQLRSEITTQGDALKSLSLDIQSYDKKMRYLPQNEQEAKKLQELFKSSYDEKFKKIEENLTKQIETTKSLETKLETLTKLLEGISRNSNTIVISGANLQIVNGTGMTEGEVNGTGNLIVGYNEKKPGESLQLGSHEIIAPNSELLSIEPFASVIQIKEKEDKGFFSSKCFIETAFD